MEFTFDHGRLERSKDLVVLNIDTEGRHLEPHHYFVFGGSPSGHYCHTKPHVDCDCHDFAWGNDRLCKHLIAALSCEKDPIINSHLESLPEEARRKVTLVCGPPAAGKTQYVAERASRGDLIWDFDAVSSAITFGAARHETSVGTMDIVRAMRSAMVDVLESGKGPMTSWIIWSLPTVSTRRKVADKLGAEVVVLECAPERCVSNAAANGRDKLLVKRVERSANEWWEKYKPHESDTVIRLDTDNESDDTMATRGQQERQIHSVEKGSASAVG